jgi:hypothetical protein
VPTELVNTMRDAGALDEPECCIDASLASAKGGGASGCVGRIELALTVDP